MAKFIPKISRRNALIGGGAGALVVAGGGAFVASATIEDFYADMVRHYLPGEPIAPGAAEAFAADYAPREADTDKVEALMYMQQLAGFTGLDMALGGGGPYETFTRRVMTNFLLGSNFFHRSSAREPVEYIALPDVCPNPFARFA